MNELPKLVLVEARRESDTDVSVVIEVDGRPDKTVFRCNRSDAEIHIWNAVGKDLQEVADVWRYGGDVYKRLMSVVLTVARREDVELPLVLYDE